MAEEKERLVEERRLRGEKGRVRGGGMSADEWSGSGEERGEDGEKRRVEWKTE